MFAKHVTRQILLLSVLLCLMGGATTAAVISQFTGGSDSANILFIGQSVTTPSGGPWNALSFNWFSDTSGGTTPSASGTLFLLSSVYSGTPADLSSAAVGFIAESQSIVGNVYFFDPSVTIQPSTQYFFYTNAAVLVSGANSDLFAGGIAFNASGSSNNYSGFDAADANFQLNGAVVPEPQTILLLSSGFLSVCMTRRLRRQV